MFWESFVELCNQRKKTPSQVVKELDIAAGSVTKWKNGSVPRGETLRKLAWYFGVSVDELMTGPAPATDAQHLDLTQRETNLILRYRQKPEMQAAVDKLLGLPDDDEPLIPVYIAARSDTNEPDRIEYLTKEEAERLKNAPPAEFDF